ncbi:MAG: substrate-binding domain-containing protein [Anaerolineales bacterium]|nr:substrate-binding domain-containing protein [Anaerolineales bacterium]
MGTETVKTIADIARLAGVSKSTVSRALSDSPLIGDETKTRILEIARKHNFQINIPAQQLSLKKSKNIAFITHAYHKDVSVADLLGMEMMGGVSIGLSENGYDMLVTHVNPHETEWVHEYLESGRVAGFVLMTSNRKQFHIRALIEMGAPFIAWGPPIQGLSYCSVAGDDLNGGILATRHLINLGRSRIAFLGGPPGEIEVEQRFEGYKKMLEEADKEIDLALIAYGDYSEVSGGVAMQTLLAQAPDLDAVFVNSDLMAIEAMRILRNQNRRVPEDVAVVGYDDLSIARYSNPLLTTISQKIPLAGRLLALNLLQFLQTGVVTNTSIPAEIVVRQSA